MQYYPLCNWEFVSSPPPSESRGFEAGVDRQSGSHFKDEQLQTCVSYPTGPNEIKKEANQRRLDNDRNLKAGQQILGRRVEGGVGAQYPPKSSNAK